MAVVADDLLSREVEADPTAGRLLALAEPPDGGQQLQPSVGLVTTSTGDPVLGLPVGDRLTYPDQGPFQPPLPGQPVAVEIDGPQQRRRVRTRQQAGPVLTENRRMQRGPPIGAVEGDTPPPGLAVDRTFRTDEGADVGDGVVHPVTVTGGLGGKGLIEVPGPRWIDGNQREVAGVQPLDVVWSGRLGLGQHLGRKGGWDVEFGPDPAEGVFEILGGVKDDGGHRYGWAPSGAVAICPGVGWEP